jgi:Ca2+-binding RTX toxin-like protein
MAVWCGTLAAVAASATPASAYVGAVGRVTVKGGFSGAPLTLSYEGLAGSEALLVTTDGDSVVFSDSRGGVILDGGRSCTGNRTSTMTCRTNGSEIAVRVDTGIGDDYVSTYYLPVPATVSGGDGSDQIVAGAFDDTLHGNAGQDAVFGGAGNDLITGDDGRDTLWGEEGDDTLTSADSTLQAADYLNCGAGDDRASWADDDWALECETRF